jgi:hypothetical protein
MHLILSVHNTSYTSHHRRHHHMPNFTLTLKKKKENGKVAEKSIIGNNMTTIFGFASPRRASSQDVKSTVSKPPGPKYPAPKKPMLKINTKLASNITPPPSPKGESVPSRWDRRSSAPTISTQTTSPLQTPSPTSPVSSLRRMSLPSPIQLFKIPGRRRKLREIREGKQPAMNFDDEFADTPPRTSDDDSSVTTEICDPSSSTTYSPKNRSRRHTFNPESSFNVLQSPVKNFDLPY